MQFWGLVAAISIVSLGILVIPLLRRRASVTAVREVYDINVYKDQLKEIERDLERGLLDDRQAEAARLEIKRRMLASADHIDDGDGAVHDGAPSSNLGLIAIIVVALPAAAVSLYLNLGQPSQPDQPFASRPAPTQTAGMGAGQQGLSAVTEQLKKKLEANPGDVRGWMLLGRSYLSLGRFADAAGAYGKAYGLSGEDPQIGSEYAESLSLAANSVITDQAKGIFEAALAADPVNAKARFYLAMQKAQAGDVRGALQGWVDLAAMSPADAPWMSVLTAQVDRAGQEIGIDPKTIKPSPDAAALAAKMVQQRPQMTPVPDAAAPGPSSADVKAAAGMSGADRQEMIRSMVKRLADRLKNEPNDKAGWQRLERAYRVLGETAKADEAAAMIAKLP